jgi:asparagine synthetase B (glutamine-hydrolysing)
MSGLFGLFSRVVRPREWMADRLELLRRNMVRRDDHSHHVEIHPSVAFGISGRGLLAGSLTAHHHREGSVMLAEGEVYRVGSWSSATRPFADAWPLVLNLWNEQGPTAFGAVDGLYTLLKYQPGPDGESLSIVNDRYGSRQLFTVDDGETFAFASDFVALVAWLDERFELDPRFIEETICMSSPLANRTWGRQIRLFPTATCLEVTPRTTKTVKFWDWTMVPPPGTHMHSDAEDRVHGLWLEAMACRLPGAKVGQQLSGGLDSRLILAEGARHRPDWLAVTYGQSGADEVRFAKRAAHAARVQWQLLEVPQADWLERRMQLLLESGAMLDLVNAHHAGFLPQLRERLHFDLHGYLGDVVLGFKSVDDPISSMWWPSPVSLSAETVRERARDDMQGISPWAWLMDTKWRRHVNWWPHLAVNDVEVRKPFLDHALLEYCLGLPADLRSDSALHVALLRRDCPALVRVPIQRTGVRPGAPHAAYLAMGATRHIYRRTQRGLSALGIPMRPWVRGAVDVGPWLAAPGVQAEIRRTVLAPDARIRDYVDQALIRQTLDDSLERNSVAHEVVLNLYRVERVLRHLPSWQRGTV